ncbi:hypothetical protein LZZ90_08320 [Flavobacterium sp. SM15]|uniref:hypothetical protein n=1 Tax=Flavobacterium sp. SM15 TaxID=2908005 RepID=UPI001EDA8063|nr:hypothetical protein [Flavobacterium sp. SM15]MCG2611511.1 hypothetical protein [Flavobacterium sp. SM15]
MNDNLNKNEKGRPFKMKVWLPALKAVLDNEDLRYLTDNELLFLVNRLLPKNERINKRTFINWKGGKFAPDEEIGEEFLELMEYAHIRQKQALGQKMLDENNMTWTKYAWLLERKFSDLNLKHISEHTNKNEQTTINIIASSDEQKKLIESIMNTEFIEIKPEALPIKKEVEPTDNNEDDELPF